ncbi:hypothetical protein EPR50_G00204460 [Perca flavescens]|uniref:Uncharacterized protein n=1 Tax=Perca flavescens TaxID=8167 RepID=A0A484CCP8_PERFV|nr:hypothetical protein EPR50_G00204460 [Perca flavescens]
MLTTVLTFFNCLWVLTAHWEHRTSLTASRLPLKAVRNIVDPKTCQRGGSCAGTELRIVGPESICQLLENFYPFAAGRTENGKLPELVSEEDTNSGGSCAKIARLIPG